MRARRCSSRSGSASRTPTSGLRDLEAAVRRRALERVAVRELDPVAVPPLLARVVDVEPVADRGAVRAAGATDGDVVAGLDVARDARRLEGEIGGVVVVADGVLLSRLDVDVR